MLFFCQLLITAENYSGFDIVQIWVTSLQKLVYSGQKSYLADAGTSMEAMVSSHWKVVS
jgi:hypothetical protein